MLATTHTLVSIPLGMYLENPYVIFAAAFAMHFILDSLLHWNIYPQHFKRYPYELVALDIFSGIIIGWIALGNQLFTFHIMLAIAGGLAPDVLHSIWFIIKPETRKKYLKWYNPFFRFHDKIQNETSSVTKGTIWQLAIIVIALSAIVLGA